MTTNPQFQVTTSSTPSLYAATFTPTKLVAGQRVVNVDPIPEHLAVLREAGCKGIFAGGTNGLGLSTALTDRKMLMEVYMQHRGSLDMIVHIGSASEADMQELARHAESLGVPAVAITFVNPFYKPQTVKEAVGVLSRIASVAPKTDVYLYHYPNLTGGENLNMPELIQEASDTIPNFTGLKLTSANISSENLVLCKEAADRCGKVIGFGVDEEFDKAVTAGYEVFIGSTFNLQAPLFQERFRIHRNNPEQVDLLSEYQRFSMALISLLYQHAKATGLNAFLPRAHFAMQTLGGVRQSFEGPLQPLRSLDPQEAGLLEVALKQLEVIKWSNASILGK